MSSRAQRGICFSSLGTEKLAASRPRCVMLMSVGEESYATREQRS